MSLLSLPAELLLPIIDLLPRSALCELRVVNEALNNIVTSILFERIKIHYGIQRATEQMKCLNSIEGKRIRRHIKSITIPSESFLAYGDKLKFHTHSFWWSEPHPDSPDESDEYGLYTAEDERNAIEHGILPECPNQKMKLWDFHTNKNLKFPSFKKKTNDYELNLRKLVTNCEGLKRLEITVGAGWLSSRVRHWNERMGGVVASVAGRVQQLVLLFPKAECLEEFLCGVTDLESNRGVDPYSGKFSQFCYMKQGPISIKPVFQSLKRIAITIYDTYGISYPFELLDLPDEIAEIFTILPALRSCDLRPNFRLTRTLERPPFPTFYGNPSLSHLSLSHTFLPTEHEDSDGSPNEDTTSSFNLFATMIASAPNLTELEMKGCVIQFSDYPDIDVDEISSEDLKQSAFNKSPEVGWAAMLQVLQTNLQKLRKVSFGHLTYGRHDIDFMENAPRVEVLVPADDRFGGVGLAEFRDTLGIVELFSPYAEDHEELEKLKSQVEARNQSLYGVNSNAYKRREQKKGGVNDGVTRWRFL
ncbi:hypothetical protein TWF481_001234 [Arthrobotrys musiformis]|uniref:F-box domain-containing protein n=1 Tax=Arthrobotrys musiformis TaxID=47236 RepID=A0AAV9WQ29_9PEZI